METKETVWADEGNAKAKAVIVRRQIRSDETGRYVLRHGMRGYIEEAGRYSNGRSLHIDYRIAYYT